MSSSLSSSLPSLSASILFLYIPLPTHANLLDHQPILIQTHKPKLPKHSTPMTRTRRPLTVVVVDESGFILLWTRPLLIHSSKTKTAHFIASPTTNWLLTLIFIWKDGKEREDRKDLRQPENSTGNGKKEFSRMRLFHKLTIQMAK